MFDIVDALDRELQRLEAELMQDVRYRRIRRIRELIDDYRSEKGSPPSFGARVAVPEARHSATTGPTKAKQIRASVRDYISRHTAPVHRNELLEHVSASGLMGRVKDPMASLAAYLSEWRDEFAPDGRGNWSLRVSPQGEAEGVEPSAS